MLLTRLTIENFKCHRTLILSDIKRMSVLIGENDAGKTVILDAIELLVNGTACKPEDFWTVLDECSEEVSIIGDFLLDDDDIIPDQWRSSNTHFRLKKICGKGYSQFYVDGAGYDHEDANRFHASTVPEKKEILRKLGENKPGKTKAELQLQFDELVEQGTVKREIAFLNVSYSELKPYLPRVERFSAGDYSDPHTIIQRGLKAVASAIIKPLNDLTGEHEEVPELVLVRARIHEALDEEIRKADATIRALLPDLTSLSISPTIDFTNVVSNVQLTINVGNGKRSSTTFGQGTNRRLWLGLLNWQREAEREYATGGIIYLYDEPETNLHYRAQQQLFKHISDKSQGTNAVQCFVCTHSIHLIDRAPADTIHLLEGSGSSRRQVQRIAGESADNMRTFFDRIGRNLGLSNTALLYEKGFLVVEGPTEDEALPILYQTLYNCTPVEDGLVLVNLHGCGAWPTAMKILLNNRKQYVHMLLDQDCTRPGSTANLTPERLIEVGCDPSFIEDNITFIGIKEYEDAFSNEVIVEALNINYPRADLELWMPEEITILRTQPKFSDALSTYVLRNCANNFKSKANKTLIAIAVANSCTSVQIPEEIIKAFNWLRTRAGINTDPPLTVSNMVIESDSRTLIPPTVGISN